MNAPRDYTYLTTYRWRARAIVKGSEYGYQPGRIADGELKTDRAPQKTDSISCYRHLTTRRRAADFRRCLEGSKASRLRPADEDRRRNQTLRRVVSPREGEERVRWPKANISRETRRRAALCLAVFLLAFTVRFLTAQFIASTSRLACFLMVYGSLIIRRRTYLMAHPFWSKCFEQPARRHRRVFRRAISVAASSSRQHTFLLSSFRRCSGR